jgi:menin
MEIANELIPHTVKTASLNPQTYRDVLQDPECFSSLLMFYDGICSWEEDSQTPVLHIGWAKPMVNTCSKFDAEIRARVDIPREADDEDHDDEDEEEEEEGIKNHDDDERKKRVPEQVEKEEVEEVEEKRLLNNNYYYKDGKLVPGDVDGKQKCDNVVGRIDSQNSPMFDDACSLVESGEKINLIQSLTEGCGENVLNLEFLLGRRDSNPFLVDDKSSNSRRVSISLLKRRRRLWKKRKRMAQLKRRILKMTKTNLSESSSSSSGAKEGTSTVSKKHQKRVSLKLHSVKMRGLKELLCSEKLNTSAIQLQLTAQSQTEVKRGAGKGEEGGSGDLGSGRPKRARRE